VQHVLPEFTVPPEATPENITTYIVDSSARKENQSILESEIRKANVICIVYSVTDRLTFERIPSFWLPYIKSLGVNVPVILIGNKIDLRGSDPPNDSLEEEMSPIMTEFKEVETCLECSAKQMINVSEAFYFAQKAVLYPTAPLYDSREHVLKPACVEALTRIFKICDTDKDGFLTDNDLHAFQKKCFNSNLQQCELEGVKNVILANEPNGISPKGLTLQGFLFLHCLFIQKGRLETTWTVLRKFGYGDDLSLREDFLCPPWSIPIDHCVELNSSANNFFTHLFRMYDRDLDGALSVVELNNLFSTTPGNPWSSFVYATMTTKDGHVTLQGFLSLWAMTTLLDYKTTLAYLSYLGFETGDPKSCFHVRPRKPSRILKRKKLNSRSSFLVYVMGAPGSGKTSFLRHFVGKPFLDTYQHTEQPFTVVNAVDVNGSEVYLILQEFGSQYEKDILTNKKKMELCDVLCFIYDSSDVNSFSYAAQLVLQMQISLPCIFIATKSDLDLVQQRYEVPPDVFCKNLCLEKPIHLSVKHHITADIYHVLASMAINPVTGMLRGRGRGGERYPIFKIIAVTAAMGAILAIGFAGWRLYRVGDLPRKG
ncbi:ERMES complex Ca(2+)-binding regulatory GTPase gem1, partial [Coelomomyces lativittatus]